MTKRRPEEPEDDDLLLDSPILKAGALIWTAGIFAIAILLAYRGYAAFGLLVLAAGGLIGLFAYWEPLKELYYYFRNRR